MVTPANAPAGAEPGTALPDREAGERSAGLRMVPDGELSPEVINRISLDDLEERRLRANGR